MELKKHYTGIGSRNTPSDILQTISQLASVLEISGYVLRSGAAPGADTAFESGVRDPNNKQIFVPWDGFQNHPMQYQIPDIAFEIASNFHPNWGRLIPAVRKLMARNVLQVMGPNINERSSFVICWTPDGCISNTERTSKTGGTGLAISYAESLNIPVFNLARQDHHDRITQYILRNF